MEAGMVFELSALIVFLFLLAFTLFFQRKKIVLQKILFPVFYLIMLRTNAGIPLMDRISSKYREWVKLFGYCSIGLGFMGMVYISLSILMFIVSLIFHPTVDQPGVSLVLPFTNVPGIGYLSFTHWIIAIFILAVVHEFSHGVVARAHNIKVTSTGFAIFSVFVPIIPAAFVEPEETTLRKESDVVQYSVYAAGPIANILLAFLLLIAFPFVADPTNATLAPFEGTLSYPAGFSFDVLQNASYPAMSVGIPQHSTLLEIDGREVKTYPDFYRSMSSVKPGDHISLVTDQGNYELTASVSPDDSSRGFLGIKPAKNERKVKEEYAAVAPYYYWLRGLIKWLFLLNFFIGMANLLPLGIVDGGRMLEVALHRLYDNKHKAKRMWGFIGLLFISTLLFALLVNYFGNPFSLFQ